MEINFPCSHFSLDSCPAPVTGMSRQPDTQSEGVSRVWSCTTLGDGLAHVKDDTGMTSGDDEAALLAQLQEQSKVTLFQVCCTLCYPCSLLQPFFLMMEFVMEWIMEPMTVKCLLQHLNFYISDLYRYTCLGLRLQEIDQRLGTKPWELPKAIAPVCKFSIWCGSTKNASVGPMGIPKNWSNITPTTQHISTTALPVQHLGPPATPEASQPVHEQDTVPVSPRILWIFLGSHGMTSDDISNASWLIW